MATLPNQLQITELDYDQILVNLIEFMKVDPAFADYDFSGSGLRLLMRVLAYVTFYQNYYVTSALNESFLDTAQLRSSVASHARMLGYDIKGTTSARFVANVAVQMANTDAATISLPQRTPFALSANAAFVFYNITDAELVLNSTSQLYEGTNVELIEGKPLTYRFTVDVNDPTQRFIIPNANIDYSSISVRVQASAVSNVVTAYQNAKNLLIVGNDDPVFFVQEAYNALPQITFGNGVVGRPLTQGNIIITDYYVSSGSNGNNLRGPFKVTSANVAGFVSGATFVDGNTVPSMGGVDTESIDNARFLAPLTYQSQRRCVTAEDYKTTILESYGDQIGAINVFGGEEGDPNDPANRPVFGRVFIVVKPKIGLRFTDIIRNNIEQQVLKPRNIVGVVPQVIDPDYIYLNVSTSVRYDPRATTRTKPQLEQAITNSILTYTENNIEKFDTSFRFSRFTRIIDDTDDAIVSSLSRVDLEKRIFPSLGVSNQVVLKFSAPLRPNADGSVILESTSHRFTYQNDAGDVQENCFFFEQNGILHIAYRDGTKGITIFKSNIGTVDRAIGTLTISNFAPTAIENNDIDVRIRVIPTVTDFVPTLNQLFTIDTETGISVQLLNDATASINDQQTFFVGGVLP